MKVESVDINYDDGDHESRVPLDRVKLLVSEDVQMDTDNENIRIRFGGCGQIYLDTLPTLKACLCAYRRIMGRWQLALATFALYFVFQFWMVYSVRDLGPALVRVQLTFTAQQYRWEAQSWTSDQVSKLLPLLSYLIAVVIPDLIKFCSATDPSSVMLDMWRLDFLLCRIWPG